MYNLYVKSGVLLTPNVIAKGEKATVTYKGLLKNSGSDAVYMHVGYGNQWDSKQDIQMRKTPEGFEAELPLTLHPELQVAFKDSAGNWDNNSGRNYSFEVLER